VRDTRWLIALGACVGIVGAILFIANGNDHAICSSVLTAGEAGCNAANERYDGGIVAMIAGVVLFAVGFISYRPGTPEERVDRVAPIRWNRVIAGVVGLLVVVVVGVPVLSFA
jgi:drug/metabolite transporter (DMT)-like permease